MPRTFTRHTGDDPRHYTDGKWGTRVSGDGEAYAESHVDPITGERGWRKIQTADTTAEFPTDWHRDQYIRDLRRSLTTARRNAEAIAAMNQTDVDNLMKHGGPESVTNVIAELRRLDAQE